MPIDTKIYSGTLKGDTDLCASCTYSITREDDHGGKQVQCRQFSKFVTTKTLSCTGYYNKKLPSIWELQEIAWVLVPNVGFKRYSQLTDAEKRDAGEIDD